MEKRNAKNSRKSESFDASHLSKSYNLSKIVEDPKEIEEDEQVLYKKYSAKKSNRKSSQPPVTLPQISSDIQNDQFKHLQDFLLKLTLNPVIYKYFTETAVQTSLIKKTNTSSIILRPINFKKNNNPISFIKEAPPIEMNLIQEDLPSLNSQLKISEIKSRETNSKLSIKESALNTPLHNTSKIKLPLLDKSSSDLFEKFKLVAGAVDNTHKDYKLTWDNYKNYLSARYPNEMSEHMLK